MEPTRAPENEQNYRDCVDNVAQAKTSPEDFGGIPRGEFKTTHAVFGSMVLRPGKEDV